MAIVLRNTMTRSGTSRNSTIPMRSTTIKIAQTGLIESIQSEGKSVNIINLGYQGDNEVTTLFVELWPTNNITDLSTRYNASLVFYNESSHVKRTVTMSAEEKRFMLKVPSSVTNVGGNYQIYFVLEEKLRASEGSGGGIGTQDDPAYKEVFISAVCKGAVNGSSGYKFIPDFDWENGLYDYERGKIRIDDKTWTNNEDDNYEVTVFLGGLKTTIEDSTVEGGVRAISIDDLEISPPDGVEVISAELEEGTDDDGSTIITKNLTLEVLLSDSVTTDALDEIEIEYPVVFENPLVDDTTSNQLAQKTPIVIQHTAYSISVDKNANTNLGMKMDAYSTPINVTGLINLPGTTNKYVIFHTDGEDPIVCQAINNYCWIPTQVTSKAGIWDVSFVAKDDHYTYYTDILKLPVVNNVLTDEDIRTDSIYAAAIDSEGSRLYDYNQRFALVTIASDGIGVLNYTTQRINAILGWGSTIVDSGVTASDLIQLSNDVDAIEDRLDGVDSSITSINSSLTELDSEVSRLDGENNQRIIEIGAIRDELDALEETKLLEEIDTINKNIDAIESEVSTIKGNVSTNSSEILALKAEDVRIKTSISENTQRINTVNQNLESTKKLVDKNTTDISVHGGSIDYLDIRATALEINVNKLNSDSETYRGYATLINEETEKRILGDKELDDKIDSEIERSTNKDSELEKRIHTEESRAKDKEKEIQEDIEENVKNIENLNKDLVAEKEAREKADIAINSSISTINKTLGDHASLIGGAEARIETVEDNMKSHIKNDFGNSFENLVLKIVFLKSEQEYENLIEKEAGTLYLIQEEE